MALNPKRPAVLCHIYRCIGYGAAYLSDRPKAKVWLGKYMECSHGEYR